MIRQIKIHISDCEDETIIQRITRFIDGYFLEFPTIYTGTVNHSILDDIVKFDDDHECGVIRIHDKDVRVIFGEFDYGYGVIKISGF